MGSAESEKTVRVFALASFLNDFGSDMIYPIWPLFVTLVLNANLEVLGLIDGLGDAVVSISQALSGYISDKIRQRKVFVWTGYLFGASSRVGYALSTAWQHLIPFRILDRAGKMRGAPRDAIVADVSTKENRGRNFGLLRAMDNLGAVCGIITCILLLGVLGYQHLFILAAIPSALGAILIFFLIKEKRVAEVKLFKGFSLKDLDLNFKLFLLLSSVFALGSFSYSFLLIFAEQIGFGVSVVPVLYLLFTAFASLFSFPFGKLTDKIGRKAVLIMSYVFWGMVCLCFVFIQNYWVTVFAFVLYGLHKGALEPAQKTLVSELAPTAYRASGLGTFQLVVGLCALPSSLIAGVLWEQLGFLIPFYFSLFLTVLSIIMLVFVKESGEKPNSQSRQ
jgi:MFS family permease